MKILKIGSTLLCLLIVLAGVAQVPFTAGNIVVYRVGDGSVALSSAAGNAYPVFLDEFSPSGTLVQSIALPTAISGSNQMLTNTGQGVAGGMLSRSVDGQYIVLAGFGAAPGTASVVSLDNTTVPRVLGLVKYDGTINTTTGLTDFSDVGFTAGIPYGGASTNGTDLWAVGSPSTTGVRYTTVGATTSTKLNSGLPQSMTAIQIVDGQLYMATRSGTTTRVVTFAPAGLATVAGQTASNLPGLPTSGSTYQFAFADLNAGVAGVDVLYVAYDDIGIVKYSLVGGSWVSNGTVGVNADDYRGLTVSVSGTTVTLYATRFGSSIAGQTSSTGDDELVKIVDGSGYNGAFTASPAVIATVPTLPAGGNYYRFAGVALTPYAPLQNQTISFTDITKIYGDVNFDPGATASSGLAVTYASSNPSVATIVGNQIHIVGAGTSTITASQSGNGSYNAAPNVTKTLTVNKATLTITADNKTKVEGQPNPTLTVTYSGFVNGDNQTVLTTAPTVTTSALVNSPPGNYSITAGGASAANYSFVYAPGTLTITPLVLGNQTISFADMIKTYGAVDFDPGATASSGLTVTYISDNPLVATIINNQIHITGAGTATITASQSGNSSYNPAPDVVKVLTVNQASLTITADDKNKVQGDVNPTLTVSYNGFVYGENQTVLTTPPTVSTAATISSPEGTYPITASGAVAANYTITYVAGTLSIAANGQAISFADITKTYGDTDFDPGATASSGLAVSYSSSNTNVATIINNKIHIVGAGTSTITASQAGNGSYGAAPDVSKTLTVNKAALTITADDKSKVVGAVNPTLTVTYTGFVNGENPTILTIQPIISTTAITSSPVGTYPITVSGAVSNNYSFTYVTGTLTVNPLTAQTISFADITKTYGDADFSPGATASSGLAVTYSSSNMAVATIVNNKIHIIAAGTSTITASQGGNDSYAAASVTKTLTVNKADLIIRPDDKTIEQGYALPVLTVTYTGFVNGNDAASLTTRPVLTTVPSTTLPVGTYPIQASGAVSGNYTIIYQDGALTIVAYTVSAGEERFSAYFSSGSLQIKAYVSKDYKVVLTLLSPSGHILISKEVSLTTGLNKYQLPTSNLATGPYILKIQGEGLNMYQNIIKPAN